jgi:CheY-like chemotaxis protein
MATKKTILAIDDDASVCDFYENGLALLGYEVKCAMNAVKARESLASSKPDLILMDIMMPDQDGISLTRELRADPATSDIPIIVVSGLADAGTLNDALLFGAVDYIVKPADLDTLKAKIERTFAAIKKRKKPQGP